MILYAFFILTIVLIAVLCRMVGFERRLERLETGIFEVKSQLGVRGQSDRTVPVNVAVQRILSYLKVELRVRPSSPETVLIEERVP